MVVADISGAEDAGQVVNARFRENSQPPPGSIGSLPRIGQQLHAGQYR